MSYLNQTYFDCRYSDYYTITKIDQEVDEDSGEVAATWFHIEYSKKKHLSKRENADFIIYHIEAKQHLLKIA